MINITKARRETPGCAHVLHLNNAGSSLMPYPVIDVIQKHIQLEATFGGYEAAAMAHDAVTAVYDSVATLLNCDRSEVAIVENATRAWQMAFYAIPFQPGDRILTASAEYASNYIAYLQIAAKTGAQVDVIPNDDSGQVSVSALRDMMDDRVKLITISHVPTNGGLVQPAAAIGQVAREADVLYLLDACQSVGQMPVDVAAIGCDLLSATSRKYLRGPRGMGFLYVRQERVEALEPPVLDLQAARWTAPDRYELQPDARRFENWEANYAAKLGMGAAVDYALDWGLDSIHERVQLLADQLRARLRQLPGVTVRDLGETQCGLVTFDVVGHEAQALVDALREQAINTSVSTVNSTRLDMTARGLDTVIRASVHYFNSEEEIKRFCVVLEELL